MMPEWDHVASDVSNFPHPDVVLIGHVDCSKQDEGDPLCRRLGITSLPTILYFDAPLAPREVNGTAYSGNHTYTMMRRWARFLACDADLPQYCSKNQRAMLPTYIAMDPDERATQVATAAAANLRCVRARQLASRLPRRSKGDACTAFTARRFVLRPTSRRHHATCPPPARSWCRCRRRWAKRHVRTANSRTRCRSATCSPREV